jgi:hypothetical protein
MPSLRQGLETDDFDNPAAFAYNEFVSYGFPVISGNTFSVVVSLLDYHNLLLNGLGTVPPSLACLFVYLFAEEGPLRKPLHHYTETI